MAREERYSQRLAAEALDEAKKTAAQELVEARETYLAWLGDPLAGQKSAGAEAALAALFSFLEVTCAGLHRQWERGGPLLIHLQVGLEGGAACRLALWRLAAAAHFARVRTQIAR